MIPAPSLAADPRYRGLTMALRGALLDLLLAAASDGSIPAGESVEGSARALWGAEAPTLLSGLTASGLVAQDGPFWTLAFVSRPLASPAPFSPAEPTPAPIHDGKPSAHPAAVRLREDRSRFGRRVKGWSRVAPGVTWDAWLATDDGRAFVAARGEDFPGYLVRAMEGGSHRVTPRDPTGVTPQGHTGGHTGGHTPGSHPLAGASESQIPSSFQGNSESREEKKETQTREGHTGVTPQGHTGGHTPGSHPRVTPEELTADDLDGDLTTAAKGRIDLRAAARLKVNLLHALRDLGVTRADVPRLARAMDPAKLWPWAKLAPPVTVSWLLGKPGPSGEYDAARLQEWVTAARALPDTACRPSQSHSAPAYRPETPEEAAARIAAFKNFRMTPEAA